jgi:MFS family permease
MRALAGPDMGHVIRDPDFRRWYLARSVSYAGTAATAVALPMLSYGLTGSATLTGAVAALEAIPYLLFGPFAGAAADRLPRLRLMVLSELGAVVAVLSVPAAQLGGVLTAPHVLGAALAIGVAFCWFDAAAWGSLTRIAGRERLTQANSLIWATATVIGIAAPALAGVVAAVAGPSVVLIGDAVTYAISIGLLYRITVPLDADAPTSDSTGPEGEGGSVRADIAAGLRYLWRRPVIRTLSVAGFGLSTTAGGVAGLLVVHADQRLGVGAGDQRIGLLYAAAATGALLAAVLLPLLRRAIGTGLLSIAGYLLYVVATVALAEAGHFIVALLLWLVFDLASATVITNGITVRQELTPDYLQGRVNTTGRMIAWGGTPLGALAGGLIADRWSVSSAYLCLTVPLLLALIVLLASPVPRLGQRNVPPGSDDGQSGQPADGVASPVARRTSGNPAVPSGG